MQYYVCFIELLFLDYTIAIVQEPLRVSVVVTMKCMCVLYRSTVRCPPAPPCLYIFCIYASYTITIKIIVL
jgi:hypothetical protein